MSRYFFDGGIRRNGVGGTRYSKRAKSVVGTTGTTPPLPPKDYYDAKYRERSQSERDYIEATTAEQEHRTTGTNGGRVVFEDEEVLVEDLEKRRRYVSTLLERYYSHPSNRYHSMPSSLRKQLADALATGSGPRAKEDASWFPNRSAGATPEPSFYFDEDEDDRSCTTFNGYDYDQRADNKNTRKSTSSKSSFFRSSSIRSLKKLVNKLRGGSGSRATTTLGPSRDSGLESPSESSVNYNLECLPLGGAKAAARPRSATASRTPAIRGIANHGNTCYMNAVLQCLSNTDCLAEYLLTGRYWVDLSNNLRNADRYGSQGNVTLALAELVNALWFDSYTPDLSSAFKRVVQRYSQQYRGSEQQDAQEFFYWLSDRVHEDLNVAVKRRYKLRKSRGKNEDELAVAAMEKHLEAHNSFISARFHGLFLSSVTCPACYKQSTKPDPFMCISLPVSQSSKRPLFVVVVFLDRQPRLVRFGLNADVTATFGEVKKCLADATGLADYNMVLCEMDGKGGPSGALPDQSQVVSSQSKYAWAFETPPLSGPNGEHELVVIVANQTSGPGLAKCFGAVTAFKVHREVSYGDLCRSVLLNLRPQLKPDYSVQDIPLSSFRMRIMDDYRPHTYMPRDVSLPLYTQAVDNAVRNVSSGSPALYLKVMLEWRREAKESYFSPVEERIVDHMSAQDLREQEEHPEIQSLRDCLADYTRPEVCQWYCRSCRQRQDAAVKRTVLYWLPDVLVFHLKRFKQQNSGQLVKLDSMVWFPVSDLDLSEFTYQSISRGHTTGRPASSYRAPEGDLYIGSRQNQNLYDLYAVCNHSGHSPNSGHYTASCRNPVNGKWYCFDDQSVTAIQEREVVTNSAYLLFYERRQARRGNGSQHSSTESGFLDHWYLQLCARDGRRNSYSSKDTLDGLDSNGSSTGSQRKATGVAECRSASHNKLYVKLPEKSDAEVKAARRTSAPDFLQDPLLPSCAKMLTTGIIPPELSFARLPPPQARTCSAIETDL